MDNIKLFILFYHTLLRLEIFYIISVIIIFMLYLLIIIVINLNSYTLFYFYILTFIILQSITDKNNRFHTYIMYTNVKFV